MTRTPSQPKKGNPPPKVSGGIQKPSSNSNAAPSAPLQNLQRQSVSQALSSAGNKTAASKVIEGAEIDDEFSYLPTPGVDYMIEDASLLALFQIRPRIPDSILNSGTFLTWKAGPCDEDYQRIQRYFENSKKPEHVQIKTILRIVRLNDVEPHVLDQGPRKMLFHGTKDKNIGEILNTGFLPSKSNCGGGLYFADRAAKSLGYCREYSTKMGERQSGVEGGWLFLCEVLLGKILDSQNGVRQLPTGYDSIKLPGHTVPEEAENETDEFGCVWPVGQTMNPGRAYDSNYYYGYGYNEYIVFNKRQARPKYLIQWERIPFNFNWSKFSEFNKL